MKKLICLTVAFLSAFQVCSSIDISANSAILYEPHTATVLYAKNENQKRGIASTTKILTAVVVLENAAMDDIVVVPKESVGTEGTSMYLKENEQLSVSDLLHGLLLQSGNDAAVALAHFVGNGSVAKFVDMMNATAQKIGMKNSFFKNPNGLPDDNHYSTAYDMALLAAYALQIPEFASIVSTKEKAVAGRHLSNHNKLLRIYEGATGVKTGYTKSSGRCLVSSAKRNGTELIAVTLSAPNDWDDHINLLDYGFNNFKLIQLAENRNSCAVIPVAGGMSEFVNIVYASDVSVLQKASDQITHRIFLPRFLYAPIIRGDIVGEVQYFLNGEVIETVSLVAAESVDIYCKESFFNKLFNSFGRK